VLSWTDGPLPASRTQRPRPHPRFPEPVPVTCGWPISGSFQPRMEGAAIAWQGDKETGVTLVRVATGERWVETAGVRRVRSSD
jgi:hypothetical protein